MRQVVAISRDATVEQGPVRRRVGAQAVEQMREEPHVHLVDLVVHLGGALDGRSVAAVAEDPVRDLVEARQGLAAAVARDRVLRAVVAVAHLKRRRGRITTRHRHRDEVHVHAGDFLVVAGRERVEPLDLHRTHLGQAAAHQHLEVADAAQVQVETATVLHP